MKLTDKWQDAMFDTLQTIYGDKLNSDKLKLYLKQKASQAKDVKLQCRNIYKREQKIVVANDILDIVESNNYIIGANGAFCESHDTNMSPISKELTKMKVNRKIYKDKELASKDPDEIKYYFNLQTQIKQNTNAFYGIQLQPGSFLYNPDTASLITLQARQLISEMMWMLERLLEGNVQYATFNEAVLAIQNIVKDDVNIDEFIQYIDYYPTNKDLRKRFIHHISFVPNYKEMMLKPSKSFFIFLNSLTLKQRVKFFYNDNLEELLKLNPKILNLFVSIASSKTHFMTPAVIPEDHKMTLNLISQLIRVFVYTPMSNSNRVFKYLNKMRKSVILSDTDSVMVNVGHWVTRIIQMGNLSYDEFDDENHAFSIVNTLAYICTEASKWAAKNFCIKCRIPEQYHKLIEMKNEFLFKRLVNYADTKKAYAAHIRLREGHIIDSMEWKGTKLASSSRSTLAQDMIHSLIEDDILKVKDINPLVILNKIRGFENVLKMNLQNGDATLGTSVRFSGDEYSDIYANAAGRSCLIWNILYPDDPINDGEYAWQFDCTAITEKEIEVIKDIDQEIYERIINLIFKSEDHPKVSKFGLSMISMPKDGVHNSIPLWIRSILDYDRIINKHLQPLASLLPSLGIYRSRISSTQYNYSPLLRF